MPFLRSSTRQQAVECFFCLSPSILPPQIGKQDGRESYGQVGTRWNWHCEKCGCWNVRDQRGEMISDMPAMHNPSLNQQSYSLRAQPSSSHLPSTSYNTPSLFCHSCLANQTLIMNLLANYLPDDNDPSFPSLNAGLPDYVAGLHLRYPPVCPACQPAVDEALHKADQKSRSEVWSRALRRGTRREEGKINRGPRWWEIWIWGFRGTLFCLSIGWSMIQGYLAYVAPSTLHGLLGIRYLGLALTSWLAVFNLLSVLWATWDPYWLRRTRMGSEAKVRGGDVWRRSMLLITATRILSALTSHMDIGLYAMRGAFALELALLLHSMMSLRIAQPVTLRLVRPVSLSATPDRVPSRQYHDPRHLTSLSLQDLPHVQTSDPVFGRTSFQSGYPGVIDREDDTMDWEPTATTSSSDWDNFGAGRQRMFPAKTQETGLESLIATWGIDETAAMGARHADGSAIGDRGRKGWLAKVGLSTAKL